MSGHSDHTFYDCSESCCSYFAFCIVQYIENCSFSVSSSSGENVPADTEVSPELIEALAKEEVAAEDLEIVQDDDGKSLIRSKSQVSMAMGGVKEGHIYVPVAKSKLVPGLPVYFGEIVFSYYLTGQNKNHLHLTIILMSYEFQH